MNFKKALLFRMSIFFLLLPSTPDVSVCECVVYELYTVPVCVHSRSHFLILRSDAGYSIESQPHNDISIRKHRSRHHDTTQRHSGLKQGEGGIMLDTIYRRGLCSAAFFSYTTSSSSLSTAVCSASFFW